jgi:hypothetical protein
MRPILALVEAQVHFFFIPSMNIMATRASKPTALLKVTFGHVNILFVSSENKL